jgi:hypothetical protein
MILPVIASDNAKSDLSIGFARKSQAKSQYGEINVLIACLNRIIER